MSIQAVRTYFEQFGIADQILEFEVSSATVELAAAALDCEPALIAKSLTFSTSDGPVMIVAAGDAKVDNAKYKAHFGEKAKMLKGDEVEALIGHAIGGVCPFGVKEGVRVWLDESLRRFEYIYPACGSSNSAIKLTPDQLMTYSRALGWCDVTKLPEVQA